MSKTIRLTLLLLILLSVLIGCESESDDASPADVDDKLLDEVVEVILDGFVDAGSIDSDLLTQGAIRGVIEALDNPYTAYLDPEQYQLSSSRLQGEFSGIGATMHVEHGQLTVIAPLPGSPADEAGIRPGDIIVEVDGQPTAKMSLHEATLNIRGKKGTKVRLLVERPGVVLPIELTIKRDDIELASVEWEILSESNIAHVTVSNFSDRTDREFSDALELVIEEDVVGIVLDLRDNPGGIVDAAVSVVDQFVGKGVVLYALDNQGDRSDWSAGDKGLAKDIPLVVLVNENTASASEVVSGALQDYGRGVVIGVTTFGKGSVNRVHRLSDGGALYVTYALWYTPLGRQIEGEGITPDIVVETSLDDDGVDLQLERALAYLLADR